MRCGSVRSLQLKIVSQPDSSQVDLLIPQAARAFSSAQLFKLNLFHGLH